MSWLGVNLNDSLSSLKGQLSNLTREVLSEGLEDVADNDTHLLVSPDRIKELESLCQLQKHEAEESKRVQAELEERLHAADLHSAHQVGLLRQQLQQREDELRALKEKSCEWGWEVGDGGPNYNHTPNHVWTDGLQNSDHHNHLPQPQQINKRQDWQDHLNQQLGRRVEELEELLKALKDAHQDEVATLQDQHRHQLLALRHPGADQAGQAHVPPAGHTPLAKSDDGLSEGASAATITENSHNGHETGYRTEFQQQLEREKSELQSAVQCLQKQLEESNEKVKTTEERLSSLNEMCETLQTENEQYAKSMEELDFQHQAVIDKMLKKRSQVQEEIEVMKAEHDQLTQQVAELQADKATQDGEMQNIKAQLLLCKEEKVSLAAYKEQLELSMQEKHSLQAVLDEKSSLLSNLSEKIQHLCQENEQFLLEKTKLQEELVSVKDEIKLQKIQEEQNSKVKEELSNVRREYDEQHQSNIMLSTSIEKMEVELIQLRSSEANLKELCKVAEDKRTAAEAVCASLRNQLESLTEENAKLGMTAVERKVLHDAKKEEQKQMKEIEEKLVVAETAKSNLEQELQNKSHAFEDAKTKTELLQSELQAKVQEITIANTRIAELEAKVKHTEHDLQNLQKLRKEEMDEVKKALLHNSQEAPKTVKAGIHRLALLLSESVWQRDTLERHVSTITQELREKMEQFNEAEATRTDLERECEDLRDQLEEIQKGVRPPPEGSSRGLPTIEEESEGGVEGDIDGEQVEESQEVKVQEHNEPAEQGRSGEIEALQAQVEALSEARRNLETEVAIIRAERETLQGQLHEAEGRTGNLVNLETEAAALRAQKKSLEMQLASLTQQLDLETITLQDSRDTFKEQADALHEQLVCLQAETTLSQHERDSIGQQLLNQYHIVEDRDSTIRALEIELNSLKEKVHENFGAASSSSEALAHCQQKLTKMQQELDCIKSQLIFKEDKVDELSQVLEDIGQIFQVNVKDVDKLHKQIHDKHLSSENTLRERDARIEELIQNNNDLKGELNLCKKQSSENENETTTRIAENEQELNCYKKQLENYEREVSELRAKVLKLSEEINKRDQNALSLQEELNTIKLEKNDTILKMTQGIEALTGANEENKRLQNTLAYDKELILRLQSENEDLKTSRGQQTSEQSNMNMILREKDNEIKDKDKQITMLLQQIDQLEKTELINLESERNSLASDNADLTKREQTLHGENVKLSQEKNELLQDKERLSKEWHEMEAAKDLALQQLSSLQLERDQMIAAITQKHQESVSYHAEIQRLTQVLTRTTQQSNEDRASLSSQLTERDTALTEARAQVAKLREELDSLKKVQSELQKNAAEGIVQKTELIGLRKEIESLRTKLATVEQERDQLRVANSHFNTQYQDQSKELSNIREKEGRLAAECERLRQHLVAVEESYTTEALKAEEREATLRSTLSKMEEKLNNHSNFFNTANQRASVQVEALQEQLREVTARRDDAVFRLQTAEENAEQHQQSLVTLQQVLQDFQKNQVREIAEATERTRKQLDDEKQKTTSLTSQINSLKAQLAEVQSGLAAASRLGEQLAKREQMIVALKAQVTSQEEVARKARDEMICLKSSSEAKVDKPLLRNLLVGYFATPADNRQEVLRIIAEVLNFSGEERARTGLDVHGTSWLSSIANFLAPPASNVRVTSKVDVLDHTSLSQAFIRFLEDESSPRLQARLPAVQMVQQTTEKAEKKAQAKAQAANKINPFISIGDASASGSESGSRNSSPLLAAASTTPTMPTITPVVPTSPSALVVPTTVTSSSVMTTSVVSMNKYLSNLLTSETSEKADEIASKQFT
nr:thyroid receptor-interacting protein 11-like isoform X1 [Procambarus clarkii]